MTKERKKHNKKYEKKCTHCGLKLDFYEDECDYCLPCFDLFNKGYKTANDKVHRELEIWNETEFATTEGRVDAMIKLMERLKK